MEQNMTARRSIKSFLFVALTTITAIYLGNTLANPKIAATVLTAQLVILYIVSLLYAIRLRLPRYAIAGFIFFGIADLSYGICVDIFKFNFPNNAECLIYIFPYLFGMGIFCGFASKAIRRLNDQILKWFAIGLFIVTFIINSKVIMLPALIVKMPALSHTLQVLTVFYTILESASIALSASLLIVTFSIPYQLGLFGILLMHLSDIALRYQSVDTSLLGINLFTHGWLVGVAVVSLGCIALKDSTAENRKTVPLFSLRGAIVSTFFLGLALFSVIFGYLQETSRTQSNAEHTSSVLIGISLGFMLAVLASNVINSYLNKLVRMIRVGSKRSATSKDFYEIKLLTEEFKKFAINLENERDKALSKTYKLAHDIRSPIGVLKFAAHHIETLSKAGDIHREDLTPIIELLSGVRENIGLIANDVLSERKRNQKGETIRNSIMNAASLVSINNETQIEIDIDENLPEKALPGLTVVLTNLLQNSAESIPGPSAKISVHASTIRDEIRIRVDDNGTGMPFDLIQKIRTGESITTKTNGNGLGLKGAIDWAEGNGLRFDIRSKTQGPHRGTTIELGIPS